MTLFFQSITNWNYEFDLRIQIINLGQTQTKFKSNHFYSSQTQINLIFNLTNLS